MRAMLVSFATQHLWLHWKIAGDHLARLYADYKPGIHWPQMQMQSGTTGINTVRIYNPEKQRRDQDPTGSFVADWVSEYGSPRYPDPIVDHLAAARMARERLWSLRQQAGSRESSSEIFVRHGSRNPAREVSARHMNQSLCRASSISDLVVLCELFGRQHFHRSRAVAKVNSLPTSPVEMRNELADVAICRRAWSRGREQNQNPTLCLPLSFSI
jgi:hypothetical protein